MNKHIHHLFLICLLMVGLTLLPSASEAQSSILDRIITQLKADDGLQISFQITYTPDAEPISGIYYAYKQSFYYDTPQMKAWYNAKDLWVYIEQNNEVNLSTPMKEDLAEINPLLNLNMVKEQKFKISEVFKNGVHSLTAVPPKSYKGVIERVIIDANSGYQPLAMKIKEKGQKEMVVVKVSAFKHGAFPQMKEAGFFSFVGNKLPGKMVIDLR